MPKSPEDPAEDRRLLLPSGGMEYALLMGFLALFIAFRGGGRYSLDRLIGRELQAPGVSSFCSRFGSVRSILAQASLGESVAWN